MPHSTAMIHSVNDLKENLLGRAHGTLQVHLTNVLPLLLEQTRQKVSSQLGVNNDLLLVHGDISNGNIQAHNLLHLELDGRLNLINLLLHVITAGEESGELTSLGKTGSQKTGDLPNHVVGCHEEIVLLRKLLHKLLVLVKLLEVINTHVGNANTIGLFTMRSISKHAALKVGAGDGGKTEASAETLVTLGVIVLKGDLDLHGFNEVTLLSRDFLTSPGDGFTFGVGHDVSDSLLEKGGVQLVRHF
mmetsp:Transcript_19382/g.42154  ORF Transcript_19382/g.42154 Transcript_19382/m.42154 type:complete len:246 (+) Transcript_19382:66-803(+)